jgi:hypothetical protein
MQSSGHDVPSDIDVSCSPFTPKLKQAYRSRLRSFDWGGIPFPSDECLIAVPEEILKEIENDAEVERTRERLREGMRDFLVERALADLG